MTEIVGVFREKSDGKYSVFSFRTITNEDYDVVTKGEPCSDCCPVAAFWASTTPFEEAEKIKWQLTQGKIIYADRVIINAAMATEIIHDVVSDMVVEDAIGREVDVLRIKIERQSPISMSLQECDMQIIEMDSEYIFFEIDVPKEAELREQA